MTNILIYSDEHRCIDSLKECESIDNELLFLKEKYKCDTVISLGDNFDNLKPSPAEQDQFANFIKDLNCRFIIIAANSHESETEQLSVLNHYGILARNVEVVKEFKDGNHLYCGHFSIKESSKNYDAKLSKVDLKDYLYVFLGHIHSYQLIRPNIVHLGSCRYINFDEAKDKQKIVALITGYGTPAEGVHFLKLKSPIPMIQLELGKNITRIASKEALGASIVDQNKEQDKCSLDSKSSVSQGENPVNTKRFETAALIESYLAKVDPKTKVKVVIKDFESFKAFLSFENKYKEKFIKFVRENDFELISDNRVIRAKSEIDLKQSFEEFAKEKEIDKEIKDIINKEIKC
jgi:DNA repair exonuclease SbcCD nuclease subunit